MDEATHGRCPARHVPIESLIPHRAPMLFVESVVGLFEGGVVCRGRIPEDSPFAAGGAAPLVLGLEMAAQTAAVLQALHADSSAEGAPRIGYLASIRKARFHAQELPAGRQLLASVRTLGAVPPLAMYDVKLTLPDVEGELLTAVLSTYLAS